MHHSDKDPIIAVATAAGRGGIGILRLSGDGCIEAAEQVFRLNSGRPLTSYVSSLTSTFTVCALKV